MSPPDLFDASSRAQKRARALRGQSPAMFLQDLVAGQVSERLTEVNKTFTDVGIVGAFHKPWRARFPTAHFADESETLQFASRKFDLIIHALCLHATNDPVGQMVQCRRALRPDGLFIAVLFGGNTLMELRSVLAQAESDLTGGLSPRVSPMGELRDLGGLLQRAGFALPVADSDVINVTYAGALDLMADLRAMGETNVLTGRLKAFSRRDVLMKAVALYKINHSANDGRVRATFETITLTGWAPSDSQPKPLRPGSAKLRLADALGTTEQSDFAAPPPLDP